MKIRKTFIILIFSLFVFVLPNLIGEDTEYPDGKFSIMYASFPVERHRYEYADGKYTKNSEIDAIGRVYLNLEKKQIFYSFLEPRYFGEDLFTGEENSLQANTMHCELTKVIKISDGEYAFEGYNLPFWQFPGRYRIKGSLSLNLSKKRMLGTKIKKFVISQEARDGESTQCLFTEITEEKSVEFIKKHSTIYFGDGNVAMGTADFVNFD